MKPTARFSVFDTTIQSEELEGQVNDWLTRQYAEKYYVSQMHLSDGTLAFLAERWEDVDASN